MRRVLAIFTPLLALIFVAGPAGATDARGPIEPYDALSRPNPFQPLQLSPDLIHAGTVDWVITGAAAGLALGTAIFPPVTKRATGGILFDEAARDTLRLGSLEARYQVRDASDVLLSLLVTYPFFVDALITATWYRQSPRVGYQLALVDAEALAITAAIQGLTNELAGRERPYGRECGLTLPPSTSDCDHPVRYRSFFSGHSSLSFTAAGLLCTEHLRLELLGGGAPDVATCGVAIAAAAATATFRVMSDVHYASDVLTGVLIGSAVGIVVPLLHYETGGGARLGGSELNLRLVPTGAGLGVLGTF